MSPFSTSERPLQVAGRRVDLPPELEQLHRRIAARGRRPRAASCPRRTDPWRPGSCRPRLKTCWQVLAVGVVRVCAEEEFVRVLGQPAALAFAGQPAFVDQVVVFHEPHEDAGQHPGHRHLIEVVLPPDLKRLGGAAPFLDLLERSRSPASISASPVERASKSSASSVQPASEFAAAAS